LLTDEGLGGGVNVKVGFGGGVKVKEGGWGREEKLKVGASSARLVWVWVWVYVGFGGGVKVKEGVRERLKVGALTGTAATRPAERRPVRMKFGTSILKSSYE